VAVREVTEVGVGAGKRLGLTMSAAPAMSNGVNGVHGTGRQTQTPAELVSSNCFVLVQISSCLLPCFLSRQVRYWR